MFTCISSRLMVKVGTTVWFSGWAGSSCCRESGGSVRVNLETTNTSAGLGSRKRWWWGEQKHPKQGGN